MNRFAIAQPKSFDQAGRLLTDRKYRLPVLKAGGMDVLDHLKEGLAEPDLLVNVKRVGYTPGRGVRADGGSIRVEAMTTLAEIASSAMLRTQAPVVAQALEYAATPQVRNVATAAGNLLQRPRCWYYRNETFRCLKKGGHMCYAEDGENQYHAIFGEGPCHIVHPSNLAPALLVCGGAVHVQGGKRSSLAVSELYHLPDAGVWTEHNLEKSEIITHITLKAAPKSGFYAIKEKQSFDWPLAMAAVALEMDGTRITSARVCAGAVAPVPWMLPKVAQALRGARVDDEAALKKACSLSIEGAEPMTQNGYKLKLLPVAVRRAVLKAAGRNVEVSS